MGEPAEGILDTDDEHVTHVERLVEVSKFWWFSLLIFIASAVTLQCFAFVTFLCFDRIIHFHGDYLMFFASNCPFFYLFAFFSRYRLALSAADKGIL